MEQKSVGKYRMTWMRSFLVTVTIVFAIFLAVFAYVLQLTKAEEIDRNASESEFLVNVLDDKFRSVSYLATDLLYRPATLFPQEEGESILNASNSYRLVSELQSHRVSHSEIEDIFVYYPESDAIVGTFGVRKAESYYYLQNGTNESFEEWRKQLLEQAPNGYFLYRPGNEAQEENQLILCNTLTLNPQRSCRLFLKIRQNSIEEILAQAIDGTLHQFAALVDEKNNVYASYGNKESFRSAQSDDGQIFIESSILGVLRYITVSDKGQVQKLSGQITVFLVFGVIFSGIASLLAAWYFSTRNTKPITQLLQRIPDVEQESNDAFDSIGRAFEHLLQSNTAITEQLDRQQHMTASSFLSLIFQGEQRDENLLTSLAGIYGVDFAYPFYAVLAVQLTEETSPAVTMTDIVMWVMDYRGERLNATCGLVDGRVVCLVNWDSDETDSPDTPVFHFSGALSEWMKGQKIPCRIGAGGLYQKLSNIYLSYSEALYVLDKYQQQLCFYDTCPHKLGDDTNGAVFYEFQRRILERDYGQAYQMLHELLEEHLANCSPVIYKYRKSALLQLVHDAVRREISGKDYADVIELQCTKLLFSEFSPQQLEKNLGEIFGILIELTTHPQETEHSSAVKAKHTIDRIYSDPTLGLASLASQLNVTGPYLSRAFKKEYQQGISEYINKVRIGHAKELILRGNLNMKEIALRVGFSSDVNFIRVFKKYENTTPGRFNSSQE